MASVSMELNLDKNQIDRIVQKYICDCYKHSIIQDRLYSYGTQRISKKVDQMIKDGSLVDAIVKNVSKRICNDIPIEHLISLVDKDKLNDAIVERVSKHIIDKIKL